MDASVEDYRFFPYRVIHAGANPYDFLYNPLQLENLQITYKYADEMHTAALADFVVSTGSTSFIVVRDGIVVYEQYANGNGRNSTNTSFSAAKSLVSLMIGAAIDDGYILSHNQSIADFIPEFENTDMANITIRDLLLMRSGIYYEETGFLCFRHDAYTYWMPDLRRLALNHKRTTDRHDGRFHYNNYNPLLLGIILERAAGVPVSEYFERTFWQPIGANYDASWSLDSIRSGFEKMESGFNFRSIDFAKIGVVALNNGYFNGNQIISQEWLEKSIVTDFPVNNDEYIGTFLEGLNIAYGYMWYSRLCKLGGVDFWAMGRFGQFLYISPANNVVIVRTGSTTRIDSFEFSQVLANIARYIAIY